jgi:hypothetical protein
LPSLITPATLNILPTLRITLDELPVPRLDMYGTNYGTFQPKRFTYSAPSNDSVTGASYELFLGPRTIVSRLSTATATQGLILSITPPFVNSTYSLQFYGPSVQCGEANTTVATLIQSFRDQSVANNTGDIIEVANYYYAFVPDLSSFGDKYSPNDGVHAVSQIRLQQPNNASNELWMVYSRYTGRVDSAGVREIEDYCSTCRLYNASYDINFEFEETNQTITSRSTQIMNLVEYPSVDHLASDQLMVQHGYSAVMWAMSDLLVGSMGTFNVISDNPGEPVTNFSEITTQIQHTSLLGSQDLDVFFDRNKGLYTHNYTLTDQRKQDIDLAQNRTLDVLIEELMFNITISFMSSNLLS